LFGEHSDWAGLYKTINPEIRTGRAIVVPTNEGIYANYATVDSENGVHKLYVNSLGQTLEVDIEKDALRSVIESDQFWQYVAGTTLDILHHYGKFINSSVKIDITEMTLPLKSGLSSSASICVLVAEVFRNLFGITDRHGNLLDNRDIMEIAYRGERNTESRCGRLDQALVFRKPVLIKFENEDITARDFEISKPMHFVYANLNAEKDTKKILADLNDAYPWADNEISRGVQYGLGKSNKEVVSAAVDALKHAEVEKIGQTMKLAQERFDQFVAPASSELVAPKLHEVLNDPKIYEFCYGAKGVGSQGDGSIQFIAKDLDSQQKLVEYLNSIGLDAHELNLFKSAPRIRKAIISVAGYGTRMFPLTKAVNKEFLPIIVDGIAVPAIVVLLHELLQTSVERVCIVANLQGIKMYSDFFKTPVLEDNYKKLPDDRKKWARIIRNIATRLDFVQMNEEVSFGWSVNAARVWTNNEPTLLCLGDQVYKSASDISTTQQFLDAFASVAVSDEVTNPILAIDEVDPQEVTPYGILAGDFDKESRILDVKQFIEKPSVEVAREKLLNSEGKCFRVFGQYILTPEVFERLAENEYQITETFASFLEDGRLRAFKPISEMFDLGSPAAYRETVGVDFK
jgi:UTP-glucose-1-phosphate uridylyltransferase/mevalonate kinase